MKNLLNKVIFRSDFTRNVLTLMLGTGIAQIITVAASPILSRIYSPADFGVFGTYQSIIAVIAIVVSARYDHTILLPKEDKDAINLTALSFLIALMVSIILLISVSFFHQATVSMLNDKNITPWLILLPASSLFIGMSQTLNNYFMRRKDFRHISKSPMMQSLARATVSVGISFGKTTQGGLIWGYLAGHFIDTTVLLWGRTRLLMHDLFKYFEWSHCLKMANKYKKYALTVIPANLIGALAGTMPIFLLSSFFNQSIVGFYFLSYSIVNLPITFIGKALSDVSYKHTMDIIHSNNSLADYMERITSYLLLVSVIPLLVLLLFSQVLFGFVFGSEWQTSGLYVQILLPVFLLRFLSSPVTIFAQSNKTHLLLYWQILLLLLTTGSLLLGGMIFKSDILTVLLLSISNSICYSVLLLLNFKIAGAKFKNIWINLKSVTDLIHHLKK